MEVIIRKDVTEYMRHLKEWLMETAGNDLEEMSEFFSSRLEEYEEHMSIWKNAYYKFAGLLPEKCENILDLGCGTGLELDEIWKINPKIHVTGVDLCQDMLIRLLEKHGDKNLKAVCADYLIYDFGESKWDAVISFESFHHFMPEQKAVLYQKIYRGLKEGAAFILGDYIACCMEEEEILRNTYMEKRRKCSIPEGKNVHFDIPLTLEHELELLKGAGFLHAGAEGSIEGATLLIAKKE